MPTITLQPGAAAGKDCWITQETGETFYNRGVDDMFLIEEWDFDDENIRALIQFDLSSLPADAHVTQAVLGLRLQATIGDDITVGIYRVIQPWIEGTGDGSDTGDGASWVRYDGVNPWATPGCSDPVSDRVAGAYTSYVENQANNTWRSIDVTGLVRHWHLGTFPNEGMILIAGNEGNPTRSMILYISSDHAIYTDYWPTLTIEYTLAAGSTAMGCTGRYSEAWEYVKFWCLDTLLVGMDDGVGALHSPLVDSTADFTRAGVTADVGMVLYNLTAGTDGPVTGVTQTTLTATGVTWDPGDSYRIVVLDRNQIYRIENYLDITASDLHMALAASGACDCTLSAWAAEFLKKLNIIEAGLFQKCPCQSTVTQEEREMYLAWVTNQMELLRTGKLEVCAGATGADFPAVDWAEQGVSEFAQARIISNRLLRSG